MPGSRYDIRPSTPPGTNITASRKLRMIETTAGCRDDLPAAEAAVAQFGEPQVIVAEFVRVNPARRAARRLLAAGPAVGGCWAAALITSRAWAWPVPLAGRIVPGLVLITVVGLLAAGFGTSYRLATSSTGCRGSQSVCYPKASSPLESQGARCEDR